MNEFITGLDRFELMSKNYIGISVYSSDQRHRMSTRFCRSILHGGEAFTEKYGWEALNDNVFITFSGKIIFLNEPITHDWDITHANILKVWDKWLQIDLNANDVDKLKDHVVRFWVTGEWVCK